MKIIELVKLPDKKSECNKKNPLLTDWSAVERNKLLDDIRKELEKEIVIDDTPIANTIFNFLTKHGLSFVVDDPNKVNKNILVVTDLAKSIASNPEKFIGTKKGK